MNRADRQKVLVEGARKEGKLTWYTTLIVDQLARPTVDAFQKKYGIKVDYVRADPVDIVLRISNEAKAGRVQADVYDGTATAPGLKQQGLALVGFDAITLPHPHHVHRT